jgi:STE24 endopeptidase
MKRYNANMTDATAELDPARQDQAHEYARMRRRLWFANAIMGLLYLSLWIGTGWSFTLQESLHSISEGGLLSFTLPWWASLILIAAALAVPWSLLTSPLHFYSGFVLPHRFGLSTQTLAGWISDVLKGGLISTALGVPLLVALYGTIRVFPET